MTIKTIIRLLNKKDTTTDEILARFKKIVDNIQLERETFHLEEYRNELLARGVTPSEEDIMRATQTIVDRVNGDTLRFVVDYVRTTTDEVLDAINSKQIRRKDTGYTFLCMLQGLQRALEPQT